MLQLGLMFFLYSAISVFSATPSETTEPLTANVGTEAMSLPNETKGAAGSNDETTTTAPAITTITANATIVPATAEPNSTDPTKSVNATSPTPEWTGYRKKRNCTPAAIDQFPQPLLSRSFRQHGGLVLHILLAIFTFLGLAIVCDDYFVASLDRICEELKLSPDVAGATFMAAGSSAPELGTVIIGVFFAQDDIGISGVIGSAVFNIMFVISVCALCSGTVLHLNWWPLVRDCFFYSLAIIVMIIIMLNDYISWVRPSPAGPKSGRSAHAFHSSTRRW